jgi:hypothetical protein
MTSRDPARAAFAIFLFATCVWATAATAPESAPALETAHQLHNEKLVLSQVLQI